MSKQAVALIAALLVAAGLAVAGCGGDDNDDAGGAQASAEDAPTITKAALIRRGDAICAEIEKSITTQGTKIFSQTEKEKDGPGFQIRIVDEVLVPEYQTMVDDIRALGGPAGDERQREVMYDAMDKRVVVMGEDPERFFEPNPADRREFNEMLALVKGYGFKRCYQ